MSSAPESIDHSYWEAVSSLPPTNANPLTAADSLASECARAIAAAESGSNGVSVRELMRSRLSHVQDIAAKLLQVTEDDPVSYRNAEIVLNWSVCHVSPHNLRRKQDLLRVELTGESDVGFCTTSKSQLVDRVTTYPQAADQFTTGARTAAHVIPNAREVGHVTSRRQTAGTSDTTSREQTGPSRPAGVSSSPRHHAEPPLHQVRHDQGSGGVQSRDTDEKVAPLEGRVTLIGDSEDTGSKHEAIRDSQDESMLRGPWCRRDGHTDARAKWIEL
ncbi:hypothetical protein LTR66_014268 [Elasticomyces elasticus]|nr:hypothetical protein LTR66_014268 [Elasticomyces elasticus]